MKTFLLLAVWIGVVASQELRGNFDEDVVQETHWAQNERNLICSSEEGAYCNPWRGKVCCGDLLKCKQKKCTKVDCTRSSDCGENERCSRNQCKSKSTSRGNWFSPAVFQPCGKGEVRIGGKCKKRGQIGDQCTPFYKPCDRANFCLPGAGLCVPRKLKPCLARAWKDIKEKKPEVVEAMKASLAKKLNLTDTTELKGALSQLEFDDKDEVESVAHLFCDQEVDPSVMGLLQDDFATCMKKKLGDDEGDAEAKLKEIMNLPMVVSVGVTGAGGKVSAGILKDISGGEVGCFANGCSGAALDGDDIDLALGIYFVEDIDEVGGAFMDFGLGKIKKKGLLGAEAGISVPSGRVSMLVSRGNGGRRGGEGRDPAQSEAACFTHVAKRGTVDFKNQTMRMLEYENEEGLIGLEEDYEE